MARRMRYASWLSAAALVVVGLTGCASQSSCPDGFIASLESATEVAPSTLQPAGLAAAVSCAVTNTQGDGQATMAFSTMDRQADIRSALLADGYDEILLGFSKPLGDGTVTTAILVGATSPLLQESPITEYFSEDALVVIMTASPNGLPSGDSAAPDSAPSASSANSDKQDLEITERAFGQSRSDSWWYVVEVENPNRDYIFRSERVSVEALSTDGVILDSSSHFVTLLHGTSVLAGTFFAVGDNVIDRIDVRGPQASAAIRSSSAETGQFHFDSIEAVTDDWRTTVSGIISSDFADEQSMVQVTIVARDASGQIIGHEFTYVDRVPVGGKVRFEASFFDPLPADTSFDVSAML